MASSNNSVLLGHSQGPGAKKKTFDLVEKKYL